MTGSSIGAMREALKRLEAEGIVSLIPQRGVKIREVSEQELNDVYQLREMIEIPAIRYYSRVVQSGELARLRRLTDGVINRNPATSGQNVDFVREKTTIDEDFHFTVVGSLGNHAIDEVYAKINNQLRLSRISVQPRFSETRPSMREHLIILDALDRRDEDGAARARSDHLQSSLSRALGLS
jgi:DNA-binding GntR family transcriptional regulator